jgi:hypothetical protein
VGSPKLFRELADFIDRLHEVSGNFAGRTQDLYRPLFPASVFFQFFGDWLFPPFQAASYDMGHVTLVKTLLHIGGCWLIEPSWVPVFLSAIVTAMGRRHAETTLGILENGHFLLYRFNSDEVVRIFLEILPEPSSFPKPPAPKF